MQSLCEHLREVTVNVSFVMSKALSYGKISAFADCSPTYAQLELLRRHLTYEVVRSHGMVEVEVRWFALGVAHHRS